MPTPFVKKVLQVLDNIYEFVGTETALGEFELGGPIQPVHDLSRESELGSGLSGQLGYYMQGSNSAHTAAQTIFTTVDPYDQADAHSIPRQKVGVWMIEAVAFTDLASTIDRIELGMRYEVIPDAFAGTPIAIRQWSGNTGVTQSGGRFPAVVGAELAFSLPLFVPDGSTIEIATTSLITGELSCFQLYWAGAHGATPPGMS